MAKETKQFQTEVKEILDLMINSLYSHREIFLRELISNSSDALDKQRFEELSKPELTVADKHIRLTTDSSKKTLSISDNGIGMTYDELVQNIGTIAYSGTKNFFKKAQEIKDKPELIGQFGVGFYSAFMVADKVTVHTQKSGDTSGTIWESNGDGNYTLETKQRSEGCGTTITLNLKDFSKEENSQDFSEEWTLRSIVKKYSDFVEYPIKMQVTRDEAVKDKDGKDIEGKTEKVVKDETLNSQKALWLKSAKDIKPEEYTEFYKHLTNDWTDPIDKIHYKAEGTQEFSALIYIPSMIPFDYNQRDMKFGLNLYVKRVFITDNCEQLVPQYLRFLKGIVDSNDLPLNVSRELIQKDRQILAIQKALVSKTLRFLKTMLNKNKDSYLKFWEKFGATLKEGIASDISNKDAITELSLFQTSTCDSLSTLKEYVERMQKDQKDIYFMTGESLANMKTSPYLEKLKQKNYEVIFLTDTVDEWVVNSLTEYDGKKLVSITNEKLDIDSEEEKKEKEKTLKDHETKFKPLCEIIKEALKNDIKDVKISDRLIDSPACLVNAENDPSAHMQRMMEKLGQATEKSKRILEVNPSHPIFAKMLGFTKDKQNNWSEIIYNQALLNEGSPIKDPMKFSSELSKMMMEA